MKFPKANKHGVYNKKDATEYVYEDNRIIVYVHVLQIAPEGWLSSVSYDKKICGGGGTMGMGSPLTQNHHRGGNYRSELEALEKARSQIERVIQNGRKEAGKEGAWKKTWNDIEAWSFSLGRQLELAI